MVLQPLVEQLALIDIWHCQYIPQCHMYRCWHCGTLILDGFIQQKTITTILYCMHMQSFDLSLVIILPR